MAGPIGTVTVDLIGDEGGVTVHILADGTLVMRQIEPAGTL